MIEYTSESNIEKMASINGIDVYNVKTGKFKTNTISFFFSDSLNRDSAAKNALIPAVLRRGCKDYPTFQSIALYLEELYGASFDCGVNKKGERQIIQFYIEFVADKYTGDNSNNFTSAFDLLCKIIRDPVVENNAFKKDYLEQEKENLKNLIESRMNDKVQYAVDRCLEVMCSDEPFGILEYGSVEDLKAIDEKNLYEYYKVFTETLPVSVFITGEITQNNLEYIKDKLKEFKRGTTKTLNREIIHKDIGNVREVTDRMSVSQAKLSLGFRTLISPSDEKYYTLLVYNGILGGGLHSKLFQNVREKASLAYYAFSRLEKFKGLMVVSSGIEVQNKEKAYKIIIEQLNEIKAGNISDNEFDSTIKSIETGIKSLKDSQLQMVDFYLSQFICNTNDNFESLVEKVKKVTKQDVSEISKLIKLDTVYFLTSNQ